MVMPNLFTLRDYINATLDANYNRVTRPMFQQIARLAQLKNEVVELSDAVRFLIRLLMYIKDINPNTYDRDYADWVDDTDWS